MPVSNDIRRIKSELRQGYKTKRADMSEKVKLEMDSEIQSRLLTLRQYMRCKILFTYVSNPVLL